MGSSSDVSIVNIHNGHKPCPGQPEARETACEDSWPATLVFQMPSVGLQYLATKCKQEALTTDTDAGNLTFAFIFLRGPFAI